jgi:hypothetical protein
MQSRGISVSFLHASLPGPRALYAKPENGYVSMGMPKIKVCALVLCSDAPAQRVTGENRRCKY